MTFSPHAAANALLDSIGNDIGTNTTSSLFYSLAFLYQTTGPILDATKKVSADGSIFVYGISDREVGGLDLQKPDGNVSPVYPSQLSGNVPPPFSREPTGGSGIRMHHKFAVIDHFRVRQRAATRSKKPLVLAKPPRQAGDVPWWQEDYAVAQKIRDRELFA